MSLLQDIKNAMINGEDLELSFDQALNDKAGGGLDVYLHEERPNRIRVDLTAEGGEKARILWLPWKQGGLPSLSAHSVTSPRNEGKLFLTYVLSGCKVFGIAGGPIWHIDATISANVFWEQIQDVEWIQDNWQIGESQDVAYIHREGQREEYWNLSNYLEGDEPITYGRGNVGSAIVGGIVNHGKIDLYLKASPWKTFKYTNQKRKK